MHLRILLAAAAVLAPVALAVPSGAAAGAAIDRMATIDWAATIDRTTTIERAAGATADDATDTTGATDAVATTGDGAEGYADNPFLPEDRTLGECSSSLPRPGCGSSAHGGWHQAIVFAVLMLGMAFIGWRIFRAVRRADRRVPG